MLLNDGKIKDVWKANMVSKIKNQWIDDVWEERMMKKVELLTKINSSEEVRKATMIDKLVISD
jgi:hypothetical protein